MKSRFTASSTATTDDDAVGEGDAVLAFSGLSSNPHDNETKPTVAYCPKPPSVTALPQQQQQDYSITRTILPFHPVPLLCKRFNVKTALLKHSAASASATSASIGRTREEAYFYDEIMVEAKAFAAAATPQKKSGDTTKATITTTIKPVDKLLEELASEEHSDAAELAARPPMTVYKSIFEPESEKEASDSSSSEDDEEAAQSKDKKGSSDARTSVAAVMAVDGSLSLTAKTESREAVFAREGAVESSEALVTYDNNDDSNNKSSRDKKAERRKRNDRSGDGKRTRKRSHSPSASDDSREERRRRKDDRRRREEKKREKEKKKRKKSRHRDSD